MRPLTHSFGVTWPTGQAHAFIQGTLYPASNGHQEVAGLCGEQPFESVHDLIKVAQWTSSEAEAFVNHIQALVGSDPKRR